MIFNVKNHLNGNNGKKSLNINVFNDKTEKQVILFIGKQLEDNNFIDKYQSGEIKCDVCKGILGPKSPDNLILGGVIPKENNHNLILFCQTLECFEKVIE
jgi:hypothetical protein